MDSLETTDALGGRGATHPRVSLDDIKNHIADYTCINAGVAIAAIGRTAPEPACLLTLCIMTMKNGFVVIGKSAPASPENFDEEKGQTFAFEDAIRQLWPLMGFALRDRLHRDAQAASALGELSDTQTAHMVDRFLSWRLPENFNPDCGIHFDADAPLKLDPRNLRYEPNGTNLFDATQARAMVRHMLEGLPR